MTRILLALDQSAGSAAAVRATLAQFGNDHAAVHVLHVVDRPDTLPTAMMFAEGPTAADDVLACRASAFRRGELLLSKAAQQLEAAGMKTSSEVVEGDVRRAILDCAARWHPDIIILGSHGRTGLKRALYGSVSKAVVRHAPCAVEVVSG